MKEILRALESLRLEYQIELDAAQDGLAAAQIKLDLCQDLLRELAATEPPASDWCAPVRGDSGSDDDGSTGPW